MAKQGTIVKKCDYAKGGFVACGMEIEWDNNARKFRETIGTFEIHTPESCKAYKDKNTSQPKNIDQDHNTTNSANKIDDEKFTGAKVDVIEAQIQRLIRTVDTNTQIISSLLIKLGLTETAKQLQDAANKGMSEVKQN